LTSFYILINATALTSQEEKYVLFLKREKNAHPNQHTHLPVHLARIQLPEILTSQGPHLVYTRIMAMALNLQKGKKTG